MQRVALMILCLVIIVMSWEGSLEAKGIIPDDSIRIRILANSDSVSDQWIKRQVRDAIIAESKQWVGQLTQMELHSARQIITNQLPEIERIANHTLQQYGYAYNATVELGQVEFPEKQFGNRLYAQNAYEALRITLGAGAGDNWWCVLFPPLCFVDGTTKSKGYPQVDVNKIEKKENEQPYSNKGVKESKKSDAKLDKSESHSRKVQPKLFIVELWQSWF